MPEDIIIKNESNLKIKEVEKVREERARKLKILILFGTIFIFLTIFLKIFITFNPTPSLKTGFYLITDIEEVKKGDTVTIKYPKSIKNVVIPSNFYYREVKGFMKNVEGVPGDLIETKDQKVYINGILKGNIATLDFKGRFLPQSNVNKILENDEYYLMGEAENSFDSRYWGTVKRVEVLKKAKLICEIKL